MYPLHLPGTCHTLAQRVLALDPAVLQAETWFNNKSFVETTFLILFAKCASYLLHRPGTSSYMKLTNQTDKSCTWQQKHVPRSRIVTNALEYLFKWNWTEDAALPCRQFWTGIYLSPFRFTQQSTGNLAGFFSAYTCRTSALYLRASQSHARYIPQKAMWKYLFKHVPVVSCAIDYMWFYTGIPWWGCEPLKGSWSAESSLKFPNDFKCACLCMWGELMRGLEWSCLSVVMLGNGGLDVAKIMISKGGGKETECRKNWR